jgi:GDP-mannose 6-dehydrogenase
MTDRAVDNVHAPRISIFGLGYVGCVSAACFAHDGFTVVGVDVSQEKVALVNRGEPTIVEEGLAERVRDAVANGRLRATDRLAEAVADTSISMICVGTPSRSNGSLDLRYVERVCEEIGVALRAKESAHIVVLRSTVLPGTTAELVIPALERGSGKRHGEGFFVVNNPEFLREGSSIRDFYQPPFTLIGADHEAAGDAVARLYAQVPAPIYRVPAREAEMVKYACNCFHAVKVGFANEIGAVCKAVGIDSHAVMRVFCEDTKLNVSAAYLRPGFAFGGSCLPKDLRAITYRAQQLDVDVPILRGALESNDRHIDRAFRMIMATGARRVALLGLAFKAGTDDLRESPQVTLVERLIGKGVQVRIFDREVASARLIGANREYIEREIPHFWQLMAPDIESAVSDTDCVVIGNSSREFETVVTMLSPSQRLIDLAGSLRAAHAEGSGAYAYEGIAW